MIRAAAATLLGTVIVAATSVVALGAVGSWHATPAPLPGYISSMVTSPVYSFDAIVWLTTNSGGVLRSSDGGISCATANQGLGDLAVRALAPSPQIHLDDVVLAGTDGGLHRSSDRGLNWTPSLGVPAARVVAVASSPKFSTGGPI